MNNYQKLIIFIAILILGFGTAILYLSWPLLTGKTYILSTTPVDPFDIFKGQYITIRYEISQIPDTVLSQEAVGKSAYVLLEKDESGISHSEEILLVKPQEKDFIKGKITNIYGNTAQIEYGIEQFFFERGATFSMQNLTVEVKVDSSGQARISKLLQNGKPVEMKYRKIGLTS